MLYNACVLYLWIKNKGRYCNSLIYLSKLTTGQEQYICYWSMEGLGWGRGGKLLNGSVLNSAESKWFHWYNFQHVMAVYATYFIQFFHNKPCICSCSKELSVVCSFGVSWPLLKASQENCCVIDKVMSPVVQSCSCVF